MTLNRSLYNQPRSHSIFRLESVWVFEAEDNLSRDASHHILGYYSSLDRAVAAVRMTDKDEYTYAFLILEFAMDSKCRDYAAPISVRSYDKNGKPVDECLQNYNLINQFEGRNANAIRFHIGDIVEVLDGKRLFTAIVAELPPTPEDGFYGLDALDDSYMVLPLESGHIDHLHIAPTHTFSLRHPLEEDCANYLRTRLLIFQGREDEADMSSICEIEGHQYLYNFATLPSKSICRRCHRKWLADYSGDLINGEIWKQVDRFENDPRTDDELVKEWSNRK